jgi:hypothetical protein
VARPAPTISCHRPPAGMAPGVQPDTPIQAAVTLHCSTSLEGPTQANGPDARSAGALCGLGAFRGLRRAGRPRAKRPLDRMVANAPAMRKTLSRIFEPHPGEPVGGTAIQELGCGCRPVPSRKRSGPRPGCPRFDHSCAGGSPGTFSELRAGLRQMSEVQRDNG